MIPKQLEIWVLLFVSVNLSLLLKIILDLYCVYFGILSFIVMVNNHHVHYVIIYTLIKKKN